jgi:hypothetical protein
MFILLCLLIVSSFSAIGLVAVWAGTSRRHWFVRTAVVGLVLGPLLVVPAYEPFVVFVAEAVVVAAGFVLARRFLSSELQRPSAETLRRETSLQFSLTSLLCIMVVAGVAAAIGVRLPELSWRAWANVAAIGVSAGMAVLVGAWLSFGRMRWLARVPIGIVASALAALPLARSDYFLDSFVPAGEPWPPPAPIPMLYTATLHWLWLALLPAVSLATAFWLALAIRHTAEGHPARQPVLRRPLIRSAAVGTLSALLLVLPAYVLYSMLAPVVIPAREYPNPNGYDVLAAASRSLQNPVFDNSDTATSAALQSAVAAKQIALDQFRQALAMPSLVRLDFHDRHLEETLREAQYFRSAGRALRAEAQFAEFQERFADAAGIYADTIELGQRMSRGGMAIHALVGVAIQGPGNGGLRRVRHKLDRATAAQLARRLWEIEERREPFENLVAIDLAWLEHALGWYGRVRRALSDLAGEEPDGLDVTRRAHFRAATLSQLLMAELAIGAYAAEYGQPPDSLDSLVPGFLPAVVIDPCSGEPLRYRRTGKGWHLYSVGYDGRDDGGRPPPDDSYIIWENGDISLDGWSEWLDSQ